MAHCCEDNRPTLNEERIKVLKDRIHADKLQLRRLESKINAASPVADVLSTDMSKRHLPHHKPFPISEQTTLRNNPIFNQERYDAMDTYFQEECHKHPLKRNTCKVHQLFEECQRRIRAAESLVEQASAERSIQNEISSLRECIEICLEEIQQRHEADTKLSDILFEHLKYL